MTSETILTRFDELNTWRQGNQRAPHKPLLVLYALGRWQAGQEDVTFRQVEPDLTALLREFGQRTQGHALREQKTRTAQLVRPAAPGSNNPVRW
jgi:hypothetical protein